MPQCDLTVSNHGSIWLVDLLTDTSKVWWDEHVAEGMHFGRALVVEHRYIAPILDGAHAAGLSIGQRGVQ